MANQAEVDGLVQVPLKSGWLLALGIVLIFVGTFSVAVSVVATIASVLLFGWLLLFTGAMEAVYAFHQSKWTGILLHVVNGVLSVVAGFLLVTNPAAGALVLTLLMAMFFMIGGLFRIITPIVMHLPHRGWLLLSGVVTLLLGVVIWRQLPGAAVWVIGTLVGIDMIFIGWSWVMLKARRPPGRRTRKHSAIARSKRGPSIRAMKDTTASKVASANRARSV